MSMLADNIRDLVLSKGLSIRQFAAIAELNQANLSRSLNGKLNITVKTIDKICDAFPDVNREWLLSGKGEMFLPMEKQRIHMQISESPNSVQIAHGGAERINISNNKTERKMGDPSTEFLQRLVDRLMSANEVLTASNAKLADEMKEIRSTLEQQSAKMREMESALECLRPRTEAAGQEVKNVG